MDRVRRFPIRHGGEACARALLPALEAYAPDALLLEGPPEGTALLGQLDLRVPPVAIRFAPRDRPAHAVAYPLLASSPEWTALSWAARSGVPSQLIDLPIAERFASPALLEPQTDERLGSLVRDAGFDDAEAWWAHRLASRSQDIFSVIDAEIAVARADEQGPYGVRMTGFAPEPDVEALREAAMRLAIRAALRSVCARVAVICGAWHAPALAHLGGEIEDRALVHALPRVSILVDWMPYVSPGK